MAPNKISDDALDSLLKACGDEMRRKSDVLIETDLQEHRRLTLALAARALREARKSASGQQNPLQNFWKELLRGWSELLIPTRIAFACVLLLTIAIVVKRPPTSLLGKSENPIHNPVQSHTAVPNVGVVESDEPTPVDSELSSAYGGLNAELADADADADTDLSDESSDDQELAEDGDGNDSIEPEYYALNFNLSDLQQLEDEDHETDPDDAA